MVTYKYTYKYSVKSYKTNLMPGALIMHYLFQDTAIGTTVLENIKVTDVDDVGGVLQIRCDFHPQVQFFFTYLLERNSIAKVHNTI